MMAQKQIPPFGGVNPVGPRLGLAAKINFTLQIHLNEHFLFA
jgi:hypothetical protein